VIRPQSILLSCLMFLCWAGPAAAEVELDLSAFQGARVFYQPGFAFLGTGQISQLLEYEGYAPYSGTFVSQSGGAHLILDRILIGGSGTGLNGFRTAADSGQTLSVNSSYGLLNLGYLLWYEAGFSLYPMLGIGSGSTEISSSHPLNGLLGLSNQTEVYQMRSSQIVLDLGLGADYIVNFNRSAEPQIGLLVGLKLGYVLVPSPPQWQAGQRLLGGNAPNLNAQGPYFSLSLGFGMQAAEPGQSWL